MKKKRFWIIGAVLLAAAALVWKLWPGEPSPYDLARRGGKWNTEYLSEGKDWDMPVPPEGVYMTLNRMTEDGVIAVMRNETAESWGVESGYSLQVKLEEKWYRVPMAPGKGSASDLIGRYLEPGESMTGTYGFDVWGKLFPGTYRIVKEIHQGTIPENTYVKRYLTAEFEIP